VEVESPGADLSQFRDAFDHALKEHNVDYTTKRTDAFGMAAPTITPVPMGSFSGWMSERGKLGGQNKVPRCANHREFVEGIRRHASGRPELAESATVGGNDRA
jgi:hypothetical protein